MLALGIAGGAVFVALGWRSRRRSHRVLGVSSLLLALVLGGFGTVLALMWAVTAHVVTYGNVSLLLASPLTLAMVVPSVLAIRRRRDAAQLVMVGWMALSTLVVVALALHALPGRQQDNLAHVALVLPLVAGQAAAWWLARRGHGSVAQTSM